TGIVNACLANGRPAAAAYLAERVDRLDLEAAAGLGRLDLVRAYFGPDGALLPTATAEQMRDGFTWACEYGHAEVVAFLAGPGVDVAASLPRPHGQTGLHWAAHGGHVETVRDLLRRRAPVDPTDRTFTATP